LTSGSASASETGLRATGGSGPLSSRRYPRPIF